MEGLNYAPLTFDVREGFACGIKIVENRLHFHDYLLEVTSRNGQIDFCLFGETETFFRIRKLMEMVN